MKFNSLRIITLAVLSLLLLSSPSEAQVNPGPGQATYDACASIQGTSPVKSSVVIAISTAATTSLIAPVSGSAIYVCSFAVTISNVVTTANTIKFQYGTGATCGTGTQDLTGAFGTGSVTAGTPTTVSASMNGTLFSTPVSQRLCAVTTIGATGFFSGVLTYVQQ